MNERQAQQTDLSRMAELAQQARADSVKWFGDTGTADNLAYMVLCLCGEAGELANLVKKIERQSLDIRDANVQFQLMMEATDVQVYLFNIFALLGVDPEKAYMHVRSLNEKRFMEQRHQREAKRNGGRGQH